MNQLEFWDYVNKNHSNLIFNLYLRWIDESGLESPDEYLKVVQKVLPQATKMYKKPFGFLFTTTNGEIKITVKRIKNGLRLVAK